MHTRKSFASAFLSLILIPSVMIVILIDKPDYAFFNFVHRNIVPIAEAAGQTLTYPARLIGRFADNMRKRGDAMRDNAEIMAKLETLEKITAEKEMLERENAMLVAKLNMAAAIRYRTAAARVVRDNSFMETQAFVAVVSDDAVAVGNVVVSNTGYLLGVIVEKNGRYARIQSARDGHSNVPVRIAGTDVFGFLQGGGGAAPELKFLSNGDFVPKAGMSLITSGVNGNLPDNIPVGRIENVHDGEIKVKLGAEMKNQESVMLFLSDKGGRYE